jgi:hypothetical protein
MKKSRQQLCVAISIVFFITVLFVGQVPKPFASGSAPEQIAGFLKDVVMLDISKYSVMVVSNNVAHPTTLGGLERTSVALMLDSSQSKLYVNADITNGTLSLCAVRADSGEPEYTQPLATDYVEVAKGFLERYETFTGDSSIETMRNILASNGDIKPGDITSGNIRMSVSDLINPTFSWTTTYNGADYNSLQVSFQHYQPFFSFIDDRSYYRIGNTDVSVTMDDAINIAQKRMDIFSWAILESDGSQTKVEDFNVSAIDATLSTQGRENPLVLYPFWNVNFILDRNYPGNVHSVIVKVWADTGKINSTYPLTTSNWVADNEASTLPMPDTFSLSQILIAVPVIILIIAAVLLVVKKRGK